VFAIVEHYKVRRRTNKLLRHAFKFANLSFDRKYDAFTIVIRATSTDEVDSKTISKWARALRYVARYKKPGMPLKTFMKEAGGSMRAPISTRDILDGVADEKCRVTRLKVSFKWRASR
jgi:hypothetical protein